MGGEIKREIIWTKLIFAVVIIVAVIVVVVDEFGKILEHAAKNSPEKEMYFLQKFCEFVNDSNKNVIFLATLHQSLNLNCQHYNPLPC